MTPAQTAAMGISSGLTPAGALSSVQTTALSQQGQTQSGILPLTQDVSLLQNQSVGVSLTPGAATNQARIAVLAGASSTQPPGAYPDRMSKIPMREGLQLMDRHRVTGKQTHTNLATWLAQQMRLEGGVTFHLDPSIKKPGITFDDIGIVDTFGLPPSSSKEQRALALAATSFANPAGDGRMDPGFEDAMLVANMQRGMRRGGPFNPWNGTNMLGGVNRKAMDRIALWLSDGRASNDFKNSMYLRTKRMQTKVIVEGINAYMHNKRDGKNGIADYWTDKRDKFDAALQVYRLTDPAAKAGGVNQNALEIRNVLKGADIELNGTTQTAASHPYVLRLAYTERPQAIYSMVRLLQNCAVAQYGEAATEMNRPTLQTFYDGVMKHLGEDHVSAAISLGRVYGINYVTPENTNRIVEHQRSMYGAQLEYTDRKSREDSVIGAFTNRLPSIPSPVFRDQVGKLLW